MILALMTDPFTESMNWVWMAFIVVGIVCVYLAYRSFQHSAQNEQDLVWHKRYRLLRALQFIIGAIYLIVLSIIMLSIENSGWNIATQNNILTRFVPINIAVTWLIIIPLSLFVEARKKYKRD